MDDFWETWSYVRWMNGLRLVLILFLTQDLHLLELYWYLPMYLSMQRDIMVGCNGFCFSFFPLWLLSRVLMSNNNCWSATHGFYIERKKCYVWISTWPIMMTATIELMAYESWKCRLSNIQRIKLMVCIHNV